VSGTVSFVIRAYSCLFVRGVGNGFIRYSCLFVFIRAWCRERFHSLFVLIHVYSCVVSGTVSFVIHVYSCVGVGNGFMLIRAFVINILNIICFILVMVAAIRASFRHGFGYPSDIAQISDR